MSSLADYVWPSACPKCDARLGTLDRLALQARRLGTVSALASGNGPGRSSDPRKCDWCDKPTGAPKVGRG